MIKFITRQFFKRLKSVLASVITTTVGLVTMLITLFLVFNGKMDFVWNGIAGLVIGVVLILAPDTLVTKIGDFIGKYTKKGDSDTPTT